MTLLSEKERQELLRRIEAGEALPESWRERLFPSRGGAARFGANDAEYVESTGVYSLEYKGKAREQDILCDTPPAPLQEVRGFNADYHFKFLTPEDYPDFFESVKHGKYGAWLSRRMPAPAP